MGKRLSDIGKRQDARSRRSIGGMRTIGPGRLLVVKPAALIVSSLPPIKPTTEQVVEIEVVENSDGWHRAEETKCATMECIIVSYTNNQNIKISGDLIRRQFLPRNDLDICSASDLADVFNLCGDNLYSMPTRHKGATYISAVAPDRECKLTGAAKPTLIGAGGPWPRPWAEQRPS